MAESLPLRVFAAGGIKIDTKEGFRMEIHDREPDRPRSPIYFNLRTSDNPKGGPLTPGIVTQMGYELWARSRRLGLKFDGVAGLPNAGIPLAEAFANAARKEGQEFPVLLMEKVDGKRGKMIIKDNAGLDVISPEGRNSIVLALDDVVTAGGSKDTGINALEAEGYQVDDVLVWIDRGQGGEQHLAKRKIRLRSVYTGAEIVRELRTHTLITKEECGAVIEYFRTEQFT